MDGDWASPRRGRIRKKVKSCDHHAQVGTVEKVLTGLTLGSSLQTMSSFLHLYEPLDIIGNGSFGIIRKVKRKSDGLVSRSSQSRSPLI
jgi:hypothetical protein